MSFIRFDLTQNGKHLGSAAVMDQARNAAKAYAEKNGAPVSVIGYREGRRPREVIYHPDGRIEKIWEFEKSSPFFPEVGKTYRNAGGGTYLCRRANGTTARMTNVKSGWDFLAHGCRSYSDGSIEWDYSTDGCFTNVGA